ncbi:MAG TPA: SRPBCC family protein [Micromonosporaceae bacterium]
MTRIVWDGDNRYEMVLEAHCDAPPAAVYDVLANLETHLDWAGRKQRHGFQLTELRSEGPMRTGAEFTSVGSMPMTRTRWQDHSVVVQADRAAVIEFHTDGVAVWPSGRRTEARWEHRYDIEPATDGTRVIYRLRRASMTNPPLRMRLPLMATATHRVMIPFLCRRGFSNLLRAAELWTRSAPRAAR